MSAAPGVVSDPASPPRAISVVIVDDNADLRRLLRVNLSLDHRFALVGDVADGQDALDITLKEHPDLLILDLMMPGVNGAQVAQQVRIKAPETTVAMYTGTSPEVASRLSDDAAHLYLSKAEIMSTMLDGLAEMLSDPRGTEERVIQLPPERPSY